MAISKEDLLKHNETVKTVATIIAVLLIPILMFVWNYYDNQNKSSAIKGKTSSESTVSTEKEETAKPEKENKTVSEMIGEEPKKEEKTELVVDDVKEIPFTSSIEDEE